MKINAKNIEDYISKVPEERKEWVLKLRNVIMDNLPNNFEERIGYGMPAYVVPHEVYPDGYHCDPKLPLPFMNFASQKNFVAFYHMGIYADEELKTWFVDAYTEKYKRKLDMGKSCMRFKKEEHTPFELIGQLVAKISAENWIETYEKNYKKKK
jgi:uncharacterized protein YdhG (YjbR/CyaY superfamily)